MLLRERLILGEDRFAELVVWRVPPAGRPHGYKYRLAYVVDEVCVVRFDNEQAKGDHKHLGALEEPYTFTTVDDLLDDFWQAVAEWRER